MSRRYTCALHPNDHDSSCCPDKTIHSSKDQLWNFTHRFKGGEHVQIRSKGQFDAECKRRGLVHVVRDDLVKNGQPYNAPVPKISEKKITETVRSILPEARARFRHAA